MLFANRDSQFPARLFVQSLQDLFDFLSEFDVPDELPFAVNGLHDSQREGPESPQLDPGRRLARALCLHQRKAGNPVTGSRRFVQP